MNLKTSANFYLLFALVVLFVLVTAFAARGADSKSARRADTESARGADIESARRADTESARRADTKSVAPDFTLKSKSGGNIRLQEQQGNVVLINFWASWCAPCREEFPHFEALQQEYQDLGFTILAVNVDKDPSKADELLSEIPVSFPVLIDESDQVSKLYDVRAMPTTIIVDRDGNKRLTHYGYKSGDEAKYKTIVKALLRE